MNALRLALSSFDAGFAAAVAAWVGDPRELAWLSPETPPPLTPEKVIAWAGPGRRQFLFRMEASEPQSSAFATSAPFAYGELNDMPDRPEQKWIGHFVLDPDARGRSIGTACVQALLDHAFDDLAAREVILVVVPANRRAIQCYARAGLDHRGEELKRLASTTIRLLRMGIDRSRYRELNRLALQEMRRA